MYVQGLIVICVHTKVALSSAVSIKLSLDYTQSSRLDWAVQTARWLSEDRPFLHLLFKRLLVTVPVHAAAMLLAVSRSSSRLYLVTVACCFPPQQPRSPERLSSCAVSAAYACLNHCIFSGPACLGRSSFCPVDPLLPSTPSLLPPNFAELWHMGRASHNGEARVNS